MIDPVDKPWDSALASHARDMERIRQADAREDAARRTAERQHRQRRAAKNAKRSRRAQTEASETKSFSLFFALIGALAAGSWVFTETDEAGLAMGAAVLGAGILGRFWVQILVLAVVGGIAVAISG